MRHLHTHHAKPVDHGKTRLKSNLCSFSEACEQYFSHLGIHLKNNDNVQCPFEDSSVQTCVFSTFAAAHRCKRHHSQNTGHFKAELISCQIEEVEERFEHTDDQPADRQPAEGCLHPVHSSADLPVEGLTLHELASLFLRMEAIFTCLEDSHSRNS